MPMKYYTVHVQNDPDGALMVVMGIVGFTSDKAGAAEADAVALQLDKVMRTAMPGIQYTGLPQQKYIAGVAAYRGLVGHDRDDALAPDKDAAAPHDTINKIAGDAASGTKQVTVLLTYVKLTKDFEVKQIVNSAAYKPGDWLSLEVVAHMCSLPNWQVTMAEPDYLGAITKLIPTL